MDNQIKSFSEKCKTYDNLIANALNEVHRSQAGLYFLQGEKYINENCIYSYSSYLTSLRYILQLSSLKNDNPHLKACLSALNNLWLGMQEGKIHIPDKKYKFETEIELELLKIREHNNYNIIKSRFESIISKIEGMI